MASVVEQARERLETLFGLPTPVAQKAVREVLDCFDLEVDAYIAQRHQELHAAGAANSLIYEQLAAELTELRFRAPRLSVRQIRRRIYG